MFPTGEIYINGLLNIAIYIYIYIYIKATPPQCRVQVEDDDDSFVWTGPGKARHVLLNRRRGELEDHYDVGEELGRGTQGITYHCVEHYSGGRS